MKQEAEKHKKEPKTKGEKLFDQGLYTGVNWALNLVISIAATVLLMETTRGKFLYNKQGDAINHMVKGELGKAWAACKTGFVEPLKKNSTHIAEFEKKLSDLKTQTIAKGESLNNLGLDKSGGHTAFEVFSLCTGGNLLLVPTKLIEDKKPEIVAKLEKKFDKIEEPVDHHFDKKTWGDLITARLAALGTVMGIGYIAAKPFNALRTGTQNLAMDKLSIENPRTKELASTTLGLLPVESITCAIAAVELYAVSKFKAAFRNKKNAHKNEHKNAPEAIPQAMPTDTNSSTSTDPKETKLPAIEAATKSFAEKLPVNKTHTEAVINEKPSAAPALG